MIRFSFSQNVIALIFILCIMATLKMKAQEMNDKFRSLELKLHSGFHIYSGKSLNDALDNGYGAVEIRLGWAVPKNEKWTHYYNNPTYGFGVYSGALGNPDLLGSPNAIFGFVSFPIGKPDKHVFVIEPSLGITYDLKPHDPETNPLNDAIGSRAGVYFDLNLGGVLWVNREVDFTYGFDLSHFSNGRTFTPNYGLNMAGFNVGLRYHFNRNQNKIDNSFVPKTILPSRPQGLPVLKDTLVRRHLYSVYAAIGTTQLNNRDDRFFNSTITLEYAYKRSVKHSYSLGIDLMYDGSLIVDYPERSKQYLAGIHPGYSFSFWRFDMKAQLGFYLTDNRGKGVFYMRPALRYHINKNIFAQVGLKTLDGGAADWVEYGLGISFQR